MRKSKKTDKAAPVVSKPLTVKHLEVIRGGLNDGLNRDIIRRKV